ncbi:MAG: hypothetical protein JSW27_18305 [Phycisphaerales bacterium]|nr:MAG: hypothetical protein JSW27_18305 [Phycisphaerales bacterium]
MKSPEDIEKQLANTHIRPRPELRRRVLEDAFGVQAETRRPAAEPSGSKWRTMMNSKMTRYAAAAVILLAALLTIDRLGGSLDGTSVAWAQVVEQMNQYTRYKCRQRVVREEGPSVPTMIVYHLNLSQRRQEVEDGTIHVIDMRSADPVTLQLDPAKKKAVLTRLIGFGPKKDPDIVDMVKRFDQASTERLGTKQQDGQSLYGFHYAPNEYNDFTVWVDPKTKLPVEIELKHPTIGQTIFMDQFEFDFDLDASAFSTEAPEGYEVETVVRDYRPVESKVVTPETVRSELSHTAYTPAKRPWMETVTTLQMLDPLAHRGKVFVTVIQTDDANTLLVVQADDYTDEIMVWLAQQEVVLETPKGRAVRTHLRGAMYARLFFEGLAKAMPDLFDASTLSESRSAQMVVMPNGIVLGICANQPIAETRSLELVEALQELPAP